MLRLSTEGKINFVEDTREYARRAEKMKKIFTDNGFHIVYDYDATQVVGDGFFFTIGYGAKQWNSSTYIPLPEGVFMRFL